MSCSAYFFRTASISSIRAVPALYQSVVVLLLGYAMLFLPRAVVSVRASLELVPPDDRDSMGQDGARSRDQPPGCHGARAADPA